MNREHNDQPPIFPKWLHWYIVVLAVLVIEIALFYLISKKPG
jgi:hypothetical protein